MIYRCTVADGTVEVTFTADHLGIGEMPASVVGDFNDWDPHTNPLRNFSGHRRAVVTVRAGRRYSFRYLSEGRWFNDNAADDYAPNDFGGLDSVLDLTEPHRWTPKRTEPPAVVPADGEGSTVPKSRQGS